MSNLFEKIIDEEIPKEEEIKVVKEKEPQKEPKQTKEEENGFTIKKGDLLPKLERQKRRINFKIIIVSIFFILLSIFCLSLLAANSNIAQKGEEKVFEIQTLADTCNVEKDSVKAERNAFKEQLDIKTSQYELCELNKGNCRQTIGSTYNQNITQCNTSSEYQNNLIKQVERLEKMNAECYNMNETSNSTLKSELSECRNKLDRLNDLLED